MKKTKKRIPIQPLLPKSPKARPAPELPPVPRALLDEADRLFNVRLNGPGTLLEHLALAYAFLDKVNREFVSSFTTCSKGCSHCCRMDVQITTFEAEYIVMATGIPHAPAASQAHNRAQGGLPISVRYWRLLDLRLSATVLPHLPFS
nr:hypothetical protein [Ralstonia pseudosolanacearum]